MISLLAFFCGTYLVAIAETALAGWLDIRHATPSLLALWAIVCCALRPASRVSEYSGRVQVDVMAAGFVGLVFDLNSGGHLGVGVVAFAVMAVLLERLGPRFRKLDPLLRTLATAPLVAGMMLLVLLGNLIAGESAPAIWVALMNVVMIAAYTSAISLPIWMCVGCLQPTRVARVLRA